MKKKTKIILILVVLLIIATIIGGVIFFINQEKEAEKTSQVEWEDIYLEVLKDEDNFEKLEELKIQLCDFDKDEVPELVVYGAENVKSGTSHMTKYMAKIYKVNKDEAVTINFDLEDEFKMEFLHNKETDDYNWYVVTDDEDIYNISLKDDTYEMTNCKYDYEDDFEFVEEKVNNLINFDKDAKSSEIEDKFDEVKENYISVSELVPEESDSEIEDDEEMEEINNVKNNCGYVVEYEGDKYFWKLTADSRVESDLYANYEMNSDTENELIKLDRNGNEEIIIKEKSISNLAIINDRIFYETNAKLCSIDLNGEDKKTYDKGEIKCVVNDAVICESYYDSRIFRVNSDGEEETFVESATYLGNSDEYIYYTAINSTNPDVLELGVIHAEDDEEDAVIISLPTDVYEYNINHVPSLVTSIQEYDGKTYISYGFIEGTAGLVQESVFAIMNEDGSDFEILEKGFMTADFSIYDDSGDIYLVYEKGKALNVETKEKVDLDIEMTNISETIYKDTDGNIVYSQSTTGEIIEICSEQELASEYGLKNGDEYMTAIFNYSIIDNEIYIVLDNGVHDPENDIGWRYSYKREKTIVLKYDFASKEIEKVYEF